MDFNILFPSNFWALTASKHFSRMLGMHSSNARAEIFLKSQTGFPIENKHIPREKMKIRNLATLLHKQHEDHLPQKVKRTGVHILPAWNVEFRANNPFSLRLLQLLYNKWFTLTSWTMCDFDTEISHCHCRFRRRIAVLHASTQLSYTYLLSLGGKGKQKTSSYFKENCRSNRLLVLETLLLWKH